MKRIEIFSGFLVLLFLSGCGAVDDNKITGAFGI